ncbi:hypothetical protein KCU78_g72, partial [Aureobasidium melanogenum]
MSCHLFQARPYRMRSCNDTPLDHLVSMFEDMPIHSVAHKASENNVVPQVCAQHSIFARFSLPLAMTSDRLAKFRDKRISPTTGILGPC